MSLSDDLQLATWLRVFNASGELVLVCCRSAAIDHIDAGRAKPWQHGKNKLKRLLWTGEPIVIRQAVKERPMITVDPISGRPELLAEMVNYRTSEAAVLWPLTPDEWTQTVSRG